MAAGDLGDIAEYVFKEKPEYARAGHVDHRLESRCNIPKGRHWCSPKRREGHSQGMAVRENVKPKKAVLDFYGHGRALECP